MDAGIFNNELFSSEAIGMMILEELKHIRKEFREEVRRIGKKLDTIITVSYDNASTHQQKSTCNEVMLPKDILQPIQSVQEDIQLQSDGEYEVQIECETLDEIHGRSGVSTDDFRLNSSQRSLPLVKYSNSVREAVDDSFDLSDTENDFMFAPDVSADMPLSIKRQLVPWTKRGSSVFAKPKLASDRPRLTVTSSRDITHSSQKKKKSITSGSYHSCKICGSMFSSNYKMTRHLAEAHNHKTAFTCAFCSRVFYRESHLTRHTRIHTGEKPYKCQICDKAFIRKDYLESHMKIHRQKLTSSFLCPICKQSFSSKDNWDKHMKEQHKQ